jgi:hypothetical protein
MRETSVEELMGQFKSIKECAEYYEYEELLDEGFEEPVAEGGALGHAVGLAGCNDWELDDLDGEPFCDDDFWEEEEML